MSGVRDVASFWSSLAPKRRRMVIGGSACVLVAIALILGAITWNQHKVAVAKADCTSVSQQYKEFENKSKHLDTDGDIQPAISISAGQVSDSSTVDALQKQLKIFNAYNEQPVSCSDGNIGTIQQNTATIRTALEHRQAQQQQIVAAARAVVVSRDAKVLADAKASLAQAIKDAQGTLDSSNGKVADNKTREALQKALDAANKVLADSSVKDQKRYQDAKASLAAPVKSVNDSVAAKAAADKAAADAAAAQAAQSQAQSQSKSSSGSSGSSSSGSSSSKRSSSSGSSGSTTRRSTGGTSGSTSTNQSNNNSHSSSGSNHSNSGSGSTGSGSGFDLTPSKPIQGCVDGKSVCPIG